MKVIRDEDLLNNVREVGDYLRTGLLRLMTSFDIVGDVRAAGFFLGVELVKDKQSRLASPDIAHRVVNLMRRKGVLISATGPHQNVLKLRPQLVFRKSHADLFLSALAEALEETAGT